MKWLFRIYLLIVLLTGGAAYGQGGSWELAGQMPVGLAGSEAVVVDSTVYFLGGYSDSLQNYTDWIYSYNPYKNVWAYEGKMLKKRKSFLADKIGTKIYYFGGEETNSQAKAQGTIEVFDTKTKTVSVYDSNKVFNRSNITGVISDSVFYIIGGDYYNAPELQSQYYIFSYNIPAKKIINKFLNPLNVLTYRGRMSALIDNNIYIFGGVYYSLLNEIVYYNISAGREIDRGWSMVTARANGRAVRLGVTKDIMVIGGFNAANKSLAISEIYRFNDTINQPQFTQTEQMKYKRKDCMAVYINNTIYVFGGTDESNKVIFDIEKYKPTISTAATEKNIVTNYQLNQNYPNPFNPSTTISYVLPRQCYVSLKVFDMLGKQIAVLEDKFMEAGTHNYTFDASNLPSGVYFYRLRTSIYSGKNLQTGSQSESEYTQTKKMVYIR